MTINIENYNLSTPIILYMADPQRSTYLLVINHTETNTTYQTIIENLSDNVNQYSYFNLIGIEGVSVSNNVIQMPNRGEYTYQIYTIGDDIKVDEGLIFMCYVNDTDIEYQG